MSKANTIAIPSGFDIRNPAAILALLPTNGTDVFTESRSGVQVVPPTLVLERESIAAGPVIAAVEVGYGLNQGTDAEAIASGPFIDAVEIEAIIAVPAAALTIAGLAPSIVAAQPGTVVDVPAAAIGIAAVAPAVSTGVAIEVPAAVVALAGVAPSVATAITVDVPAAVVGIAAAAPTVAAGAAPAADYWSDWAAQNYGWDADLFPDWWGN